MLLRRGGNIARYVCPHCSLQTPSYERHICASISAPNTREDEIIRQLKEIKELLRHIKQKV